MKVMTDKQWKTYEDYISTLEIKYTNLCKDYDVLKKEKEELEKKYKKLKMQAYLKGID